MRSITGVAVPPNTTIGGQIAELLAAAELLERGWLVYAPITRASRGHDLIACKGTHVLTVEVRRAHRGEDGRLVGNSENRKMPSACFAFVVTAEPITFIPALPE
jgi:Holliday junction resolvase-like predicted endonuclease